MKSNSSSELYQQRNDILDQMRALDQMRRGSLSQQFFGSGQPNASNHRGPYFVLQGYLQGQKFSQRVPAEQAPDVQAQVDNYKRFRNWPTNLSR